MKRIVALIDFSEVTSGVVRVARDMALALNSELLLAHVAEAESDFVDSEVQEDTSAQLDFKRSHHREMEILGLELKKQGVNVVIQITASPRDRVRATILEMAARLSPDLIVIGSHGHGRLHQFLTGSVADSVVRKAACPVVLVPSRQAPKI